MLDQVTAFLNVLIGQSGVTHMSFGNVVMIAIGAAMIAIAAAKRFEPFLLAGIGFACIIANVPGSPLAFLGGNAALSQAADGGLFHYAWLGIAQLIIPPLIFLGIGAMTDFGAVIAKPKLIVLGAGAQLGIFAALILANSLGFTMQEAGAIGILGAADGPIALFVTAKLAPHLLGPVAVVAYASTALIFMMQPRAMRLLTAGPERHRAVTKLEKIAFPIVIALIFSVLLPQIAPLMVMLMLGNLLREVGPTGRVSRAALGMTKVLTAVLAVAIGSSMAADSFLTAQTGQVIALAIAAFACAAASTVATAKLMNLFLLKPISPSIGRISRRRTWSNAVSRLSPSTKPAMRSWSITPWGRTWQACLALPFRVRSSLRPSVEASQRRVKTLSACRTTPLLSAHSPSSWQSAQRRHRAHSSALPLFDRLEPVRAVKIRFRKKPVRARGEAAAIPDGHVAAISAAVRRRSGNTASFASSLPTMVWVAGRGPRGPSWISCNLPSWRIPASARQPRKSPWNGNSK